MAIIRKMIGLSLWFTGLFFAYMFVCAKKRNIVHHQLDVGSVSQCNTQLKVFFISDIHRRRVDEKLLKKIQTSIDLVVIGGDLVEKGVPLSRVSKNIQSLATLGPVFFIWGNNDREAGEEAIRKILAEHGAVVLDNENLQIPGHPTWGICGTDDPSSGKVDIAAALQGIERHEKVLVVSHQPQVLRKIERLYRPTLMLAGHTHGGQIRMGRFGLFEKGAFKIFAGCGELISNGYGTSTIPFRLGAQPECHVITINYADQC